MKEDCSEAPNAKTSEATDNVNNKGKSGDLPSNLRGLCNAWNLWDKWFL